MAENSLGFATVIDSPEQISATRLLIASLRAFGGPWADSPVWVFDRTQAARSQIQTDSGVEVIPLKLPTATQDYFFAARVAACAQAETLTVGKLASLVCIDPEYLIVNPPDFV